MAIRPDTFKYNSSPLCLVQARKILHIRSLGMVANDFKTARPLQSGPLHLFGFTSSSTPSMSPNVAWSWVILVAVGGQSSPMCWPPSDQCTLSNSWVRNLAFLFALRIRRSTWEALHQFEPHPFLLHTALITFGVLFIHFSKVRPHFLAPRLFLSLVSTRRLLSPTPLGLQGLSSSLQTMQHCLSRYVLVGSGQRWPKISTERLCIFQWRAQESTSTAVGNILLRYPWGPHFGWEGKIEENHLALASWNDQLSGIPMCDQHLLTTYTTDD